MFFSNKYDINDGAITFKSVSLGDEGFYQCVAENEFGSISSSASLTVEPGTRIASYLDLKLMWSQPV